MTELNAVIGQDGVYLVRYGLYQAAQECHCPCPVRLRIQLGIGELAGTVNCNKEMELAFFRPHLGNIDMEIANRILLELASCPAFLELWQSGDAMTLQAAMQT